MIPQGKRSGAGGAGAAPPVLGTYWVDAVSGDDANTGETRSVPKQSLEALLRLISGRMTAHVTINLLATTTTIVDNIRVELPANYAITIQPDPEAAWFNVVLDDGAGNEITFTPSSDRVGYTGADNAGLAMTTSAHSGQMLYADGASRILPIFDNDATSIWTICGGAVPVTGKVVVPSRTLSLATFRTFEIAGAGRLILSKLALDLHAATGSEENFDADGSADPMAPRVAKKIRTANGSTVILSNCTGSVLVAGQGNVLLAESALPEMGGSSFTELTLQGCETFRFESSFAGSLRLLDTAGRCNSGVAASAYISGMRPVASIGALMGIDPGSERATRWEERDGSRPGDLRISGLLSSGGYGRLYIIDAYSYFSSPINGNVYLENSIVRIEGDVASDGDAITAYRSVLSITGNVQSLNGNGIVCSGGELISTGNSVSGSNLGGYCGIIVDRGAMARLTSVTGFSMAFGAVVGLGSVIEASGCTVTGNYGDASLHNLWITSISWAQVDAGAILQHTPTNALIKGS